MNRIKDLIKNITTKRLIISSVGGFITGLGVMMLSISALGADAPTVFREGIFRTFGINEGITNIILGIIMVGITFYVDHKQLGIGTIINIFTVSWGMDLIKATMFNTSLNPYLLFFIGLVVIAIGVGLTVNAKLGATYYDAFCQMGGAAIGKSYAVFRYPTDAVMLISGYLWKGTVGVGTIICLLFIGPIIDISIKYFGMLLRDL